MMDFFFASWPRRLASGLLVYAAGLVGILLLTWKLLPDQPWDTEALIMRLFILPLLLAIATLSLGTACTTRGSVTPGPAEAAAAPPAEPFRAQVVGVQWLNPLVRRDYPTEWQLLWVQGLAQPNKNDYQVKTEPEVFTRVGFVASIVSNIYQTRPLDEIFERYAAKILRPFGTPYALYGTYFYTVQPKNPKHWRELAGIRVELAIPDTPRLPPAQAAEFVRTALRDQFAFYRVPTLSTADIPADVSLTVGGASAGFHSLAAAMDYLEAHPDKSVWVMNWDAPDFPNDKSIAENCTLLILAGPRLDTQREPLAWIARPAVRSVADATPAEGRSRAAQAWHDALRVAAEQAKVEPARIGRVIHDAGSGAAAGERIGRLAGAMSETLPELDFLKDGFNTAKLLGDMGAGSAVTNLALAVAWTHQKGHPVLVAGTTEPDRATAVVVTPPARARRVDPTKDWFRARGERHAYLPWWGLRKDVKWEGYMQGYSQ